MTCTERAHHVAEP